MITHRKTQRHRMRSPYAEQRGQVGAGHLGKVRIWLVGQTTAALAGLMLLSGCEIVNPPPQHKIVNVSGQVMLDGQPLRNAIVIFIPVDAEGVLAHRTISFDDTNDEGRFTLKFSEKDLGTYVGLNRVIIGNCSTISSKEPNGVPMLVLNPREDQIIPIRYNEFSTLTFKVPEKGTNAAKFELTTP
jgi:hypothetical protein